MGNTLCLVHCVSGVILGYLQKCIMHAYGGLLELHKESIQHCIMYMMAYLKWHSASNLLAMAENTYLRRPPPNSVLWKHQNLPLFSPFHGTHLCPGAPISFPPNRSVGVPHGRSKSERPQMARPPGGAPIPALEGSKLGGQGVTTCLMLLLSM